MKHIITLIPGDGTGPEISEATIKAIEATGVDIKWDIVNAGAEVYEKEGTVLPDSVINSLKKNRVGIKGPITTPIGTGFRSVNVAMRRLFELYACVRPCKSYQGVKSRYSNIDLVIIRENTEDLYAGIEFEKGKMETEELIDWLNKHSSRKIGPNAGISIKPISMEG